MKTLSPSSSTIEKKWYVVDAKGKTLGRLATVVADSLRGKRKAIYTPNIDTGDFVVVINAGQVVVTGKKRGQKVYYHHSGYPGGLGGESYAHSSARRPEEISVTPCAACCRTPSSAARSSASSRSTPVRRIRTRRRTPKRSRSRSKAWLMQ